MTQPLANEELSAYLDGELEDAEVAELEARLAADPGLREQLDMLREAVDFMRTHGPAQAPPTLYGNVMRAVEDEPMPGSWWRWLRRPFGLPIEGIAVAAAAAVVLIFALDLGPDSFTTPESADAEPAAPMSKGDRPAGEDSLDRKKPDSKSASEQVADAEHAYDSKIVPKELLRKRTMGVEDDLESQGSGEAPEISSALTSRPTPDGTSTRTTDTGPQLLGVSAPYAAYGLRTDDVYTLGKLERIVTKLGGSMTVRSGSVEDNTLEPGGRVELMLNIPHESLADFDRLVNNLGLVQKKKGNPRDVINSEIVDIPLYIDVGGEPPPGPSQPPAH